MRGWTIRADTPGHVLATRANMVLCRVTQAPTSVVLLSLEEAIRANRGSAVVVIHVGASVGLPDTETRTRAVRLMRGNAERIEAWVVVLEGAGLLRAALRSAANTIRLMARPSFLFNVVGTAPEAVEWLTAETAARIALDDLAWPAER